jgi:hypothetical protein
MIKFFSFTRWPCRNDLGLVHPLPVCSVHRSISCRDDICHAVRKLSFAFINLMTEPGCMKDERWAVLFLGQVGSARVCALGELDHWLGECDWSSRPGLLYRLHLVRQILYLYGLNFKFIMYGLSAQMITTAITIGSDGRVVLGSGATYGILVAILVFHGVVCSAATRILARLNLAYVVINGEFPPLPRGCFPLDIPILNFIQLERLFQLSFSYLSVQNIGEKGSRRTMRSLCLRTTPDGPAVSSSPLSIYFI